MTSDVESIFMCSFAIHVPSLEKCLFNLFGNFLNQAFDFFIIEFWKFFIYSRYKSFISYRLWKYFLCGLPLHPLKTVCQGVDVLNFDQDQFIFKNFMNFNLAVMFKTYA